MNNTSGVLIFRKFTDGKWKLVLRRDQNPQPLVSDFSGMSTLGQEHLFASKYTIEKSHQLAILSPNDLLQGKMVKTDAVYGAKIIIGGVVNDSKYDYSICKYLQIDNHHVWVVIDNTQYELLTSHNYRSLKNNDNSDLVYVELDSLKKQMHDAIGNVAKLRTPTGVFMLQVKLDSNMDDSPSMTPRLAYLMSSAELKKIIEELEFN